MIENAKMVREGNKLSEKARDIDAVFENLRGQLQTLIGVIELCGVLEGDCKYCRPLELR